MSRIATHVKEWIPAALAVCAVMLTAGYAVTKRSHAAEGIRDVSNLASTLADVATRAERTTRSPEEIEELAALRSDLERRMENARKPGLVVPELTEAARRAHLSVRGIQPISRADSNAGQQASVVYPRYRILVQGTYSQIAEYMDLCKRQKTPARVMGFRIARNSDEDGAEPKGLTADITVEAFQPCGKKNEGQDTD